LQLGGQLAQWFSHGSRFLVKENQAALRM